MSATMPRLVHDDTEEHIQSTGRTKWQESCTPPTTLPNVRLQTGGRRDSSGERAVCGARCPPSAADGRQLRPGDDGRWRCLCEKRPTLGPRMGTSLRRRWKKRTVCHRTAKRCRPAISTAEVKGMRTNEANAAKTKGGHAIANFFGKCAFGQRGRTLGQFPRVGVGVDPSGPGEGLGRRGVSS